MVRSRRVNFGWFTRHPITFRVIDEIGENSNTHKVLPRGTNKTLAARYTLIATRSKSLANPLVLYSES